MDLVVGASAIDARKHVNNLQYLQWCLEAAENHWISNAPSVIREQYVWYVLRHEISYKAAAYEGEKLRVTTWVSSSEGVKSERRYRIHRLSDGTLLVEASTQWCLLDAQTLRPARITEEIRNLFLE